MNVGTGDITGFYARPSGFWSHGLLIYLDQVLADVYQVDLQGNISVGLRLLIL